jgi:hypothetical protein
MINDLQHVIFNNMAKGQGAFIIQPYTEVNVKRGLQYEVSHFFSAVASTASVTISITTTSKPLILKGKELAYTGERIEYVIEKGAEVSGGTVKSIGNRSDDNPVTSTVTVRANPTVDTAPTFFGSPRNYLGSTNQGSRVSGSGNIEGLERILAPNKTYLITITNFDANPVNIDFYVTWYEGEPDYEGEG